MKGALPRGFQPGTEITAELLDAILQELWRWRRVEAASPMVIDHADSDEPPLFLYYPQDANLIPCYTGGGGLSAGSIASPTSATVTLLESTGTSGAYTTSGAGTDTMLNLYTTAVGASKFCWGTYRGGFLYLVTGDC